MPPHCCSPRGRRENGRRVLLPVPPPSGIHGAVRVRTRMSGDVGPGRDRDANFYDDFLIVCLGGGGLAIFRQTLSEKRQSWRGEGKRTRPRKPPETGLSPWAAGKCPFFGEAEMMGLRRISADAAPSASEALVPVAEGDSAGRETENGLEGADKGRN